MKNSEMSQFKVFFIIGAPKCGTTSLASWLNEHPQVFLPSIKEPHFFSTDLNNRKVKTWNQYNKLFDAASDKQIAGEASTWYMYSEEAIANIEKHYDGVKYIVMTRNPSEMAFSLFRHNVRTLNEDVDDFSLAWSLQEDRNNGTRDISKYCDDPAYLQYCKACALGDQLERLILSVPVDRIHHIALADLKKNPSAEYEKALSFLGVEKFRIDSFQAENVARSFRSVHLQKLIKLGARLRRAVGIKKGLGLSKLNDKNVHDLSLSDEMRERLNTYFYLQNKKLQEMVEAINRSK